MTGRIFLLGLGVATALAACPPAASAQVVDDFLCSTFTYKCNQQKPLPPPQLAPAEAPKPVAAKHAARVHKAKRPPAPKASAPPAAPSPAPQ